MAAEAATLTLGAQMAILFLGVNIGLPFFLSAVLALIVIVIVRTHSFFKGIMGNSCSSNLVQDFEEIPSSTDTAGQPDENGNSMTNKILGKKGLDNVRWADIRKRRPSVTNAVLSVESTESSPQPASSTSPDMNSGTSREITSSESSRASRTSNGHLGRRRILSSSSSRVSPLSPEPTSPLEPKKFPDSWAWLEEKSDSGIDKISARGSITSGSTFLTNRSKGKRKTSDSVASPSQCQVEGLHSENGMDYQPVFKDDLAAYDIW